MNLRHLNFVDINTTMTIPLFDDGVHSIHWVGIQENTAFRSNAYLIKNRDTYIIVDPGGLDNFVQVRDRIASLVDIKSVFGIILCHQDPDVAGSMVEWLNINPNLKVFTSPRTQVLLPHYGRSDYDYYNISDNPVFVFPNSSESLVFIESPFLHFPGAFTTFDNSSKFLFSGDIWAALDIDWKLVVENFDNHSMSMDLFHLDYMASNIAARGYANKIQNLGITSILTQHGSIIDGENVANAINYLKNLRCGLDIIYPELILE
jgi:flavorubredoxin